MEESKINQGKKKITIKMGGGGFGAVVLLGGALATAAFASAFVFRKNGRSSGKDRSGRHHNPPPEIDKQKEQDEADKAQQFVFLDQPSHVNNNPSSEAIKEVEQDNDDAFLVSNQSSALDEKSKPDNICDIESTEQILCPISPKELKTDVISNGYVVIEEKFPLMDEKLQFQPQNMMHGDEIAIHLTKDDVYNEIPKGNQNPEQVHFVEERAESEHDQEDIKVILVDNVVEGVGIDRNEAEKNVHTEVDMKKNELEDVLDSRVTEYGNVNGEENEFIDGSEGDYQMNHFAEQFVKKREKCDPPDEIIVVEKCEDQIDVLKGGKISCNIKEEVIKDGENDLGGEIKEDDLDKENSEDEENNGNLTKINQDNKGAEKDERESEGSRTIDEDSFLETNQVKLEIEKGNDTEKTFIMKCVAELAMSNDRYLTDSTDWKIIIIIATVFVMSSLSCSWFFGLSFVELCLVVFVTMVLSSWLLHSRHEIGKHIFEDESS